MGRPRVQELAVTWARRVWRAGWSFRGNWPSSPPAASATTVCHTRPPLSSLLLHLVLRSACLSRVLTASPTDTSPSYSWGSFSGDRSKQRTPLSSDNCQTTTRIRYEDNITHFGYQNKHIILIEEYITFDYILSRNNYGSSFSDITVKFWYLPT